MNKNDIYVDNLIFDMFENLHLGIIICKDINNQDLEKTKDLLEKTIASAQIELSQLADLKELKIIPEWRNAYKQFNEKKNRSSIESLLRRIYNGKPVSCINPLVDLYNIISIKYKLPCGGEDLNTLSNDITLCRADGTENFVTLGETESEHPNVGEVIYKSGNLVLCRCFNWRESEISKLTENTTYALLCIECLNQEDVPNLKLALDELSTLITDLLGGHCSSYILNKTNPSANWA